MVVPGLLAAIIAIGGRVEAQDTAEVTFSQPPTEDQENLPSIIDWNDDVPNVVVADDFVSGDRLITSLRWWGSERSDAVGPLYGSDPGKLSGDPAREPVLLTVDSVTGQATIVGDIYPAVDGVTEIEWSPDGETLHATVGGVVMASSGLDERKVPVVGHLPAGVLVCGWGVISSIVSTASQPSAETVVGTRGDTLCR